MVALVLLAQGAARAAPLGWEGTLSFELLATNPSYQVEGGGVASVNASSGGLPAHLATLRLAGSRHNLSLAETRLLTDPDVAAGTYDALRVTVSLGTGTVSEFSGGAPGARALPLRGLVGLGALVRSFPPSPTTAPLTRLTVNGASAGLGVGGGYFSRNTIDVSTIVTDLIHTPGSSTFPHWGTRWGHQFRWVSIQGAPWTIKTAIASALDPPVFDWMLGQTQPPVVTATRRGFVHGPFSATTSTAQPGGMLQMVTPMQIRVYDWRLGYKGRVYGGTGWAAGGFGVLTLRFIPEPAAGLLLATGIAGLVAIGRQRIRK